MVDLVGLVPQRALPLGGLLQQVMPGDLAVMRSVEAAIVVPIDSWGLAHRLVHIADQTAVDGEPDEDRKIAFGDAEGLVDLSRVAPLRDDMPGPEDQPVRAAARAHRPQHLAPRRGLVELARNLDREVAAPRRLALGSVTSGGIKRGGSTLLPNGRLGRRDITHGNNHSSTLILTLEERGTKS
jgi:hypothetical protein